jgi:predicted enzyme related to lactoylglutathione lyase
MANLVSHFEIDADDVERARRFYESVFGWKISPWGPPNYYLIDAGGGMSGDIRERRNPASPGNAGFVITVTVDDLPAITAAVVKHGGTIATQAFRIDGVGDLMYFNDTEGHRVGVMQRIHNR